MKIAKLRDMSTEELKQRREEMQKQIFQLRLQTSTGLFESASKIAGLRKDIARILTLLQERKKSAA
jgi:large subunit ribosomal protein L29